MNNNAIITIEHVSKVYGSRFAREKVHALKDVSFTVNRGEVFGILGPNGAGKTTLIKSLLGIIRFQGTATVAGERAGSMAARKKVGYLPENTKLPEYLTGEQCIFHFGQVSGLSKLMISNRMDDLLNRVGMQDARTRKTKTYSKGMRQRIGLATALIAEPEVIFLDEPTDGLDPVGRKDIRLLMEELRDQGKTVVVNSHLLHELELVCDRVAVLNKGELLTVDKTENLTVQTARVGIQLAEMTDEQFQKIQQRFLDINFKLQRETKRVSIRFENESQAILDSIIDALRAEQISIQKISQGRVSLEEAFLNLLSTKEASQ